MNAEASDGLAFDVGARKRAAAGETTSSGGKRGLFLLEEGAAMADGGAFMALK